MHSITTSQFTSITISHANPSRLLADGRASGSSLNNLKPTSKTTSNYESSGDLGRGLFDKNPTASLEVGGRALGLSNDESSGDLGRGLFANPTASLEVVGRSSGLSNDEPIGNFGRWLFANPLASLEVGGRASGLSNYNASVTEVKIERMRIIRPRDALARSRYVQTTRVCETSITAPGVPGGTGPEHD